MTELHELPTPAAGRVGMCRKSIEEALKMGFSLDDCARRLGLNYKTFWQAYRANKIIVEPEKQVPLPALPRPATQVKQPVNVVKGVTTSTTAQTETPTVPRPLPGQIPVGDGDAMNAELAARGIVFK